MSVMMVACQGLKMFEGTVDDDFRSSHFDHDAVEVNENTKWPCFGDGLEVGSIYMYEEDAWFDFGKERVLNADLEKLADLVGYDWRMPGADDPGPFREMFRWGGRGTIGPIVSAKLVADFAEWDERARALGDDHFYGFYKNSQAMFEFATRDGCVFLRCS
ncbi:hypothetical protein CR51_40955 [Caballeronia megalochromosomata]|nr:hypothetical protein CR51_40955 [Caballeronia megalochromosomata]